MHYRVVSLVLLPCVLLTQCAWAAHCHCRHVQGHDARPHFHLTGFLSACSATHDDEDDGDEHDRQPSAPDDDPDDHDGQGVIYLPASIAHGWYNGSAYRTQDATAYQPLPAFCANLLIEPPLARANHSPPFLTVPDCATFLRNRTFLI